jgi:membrane-bound serine protease (ClpP class)
MLENPLIVPLVMQLLGVGVLISEFLIPSAGLLSVLSIGLFGASIYLVFAHVSTNAGFAVVAADAVIIPVLVIVGLKLIAQSPLALRTTLSREDGVNAQNSDLDKLVGKEGRTLSLLRPAGVAMVDGVRLDVVSTGAFIAKDSPIVVEAVTGNQIVVRAKESALTKITSTTVPLP